MRCMICREFKIIQHLNYHYCQQPDKCVTRDNKPCESGIVICNACLEKYPPLVLEGLPLSCSTCSREARFMHYTMEDDEITDYRTTVIMGTLSWDSIPMLTAEDLQTQIEHLPYNVRHMLDMPLEVPEKSEQKSVQNTFWWHTEWVVGTFRPGNLMCFPGREDREYWKLKDGLWDRAKGELAENRMALACFTNRWITITEPQLHHHPCNKADHIRHPLGNGTRQDTKRWKYQRFSWDLP